MIIETNDKMKQYRITTADILSKDDNDCILDPNDPVHDLIAVSQLGGLGGQEALNRYRLHQLPTITSSNKGQIQRENNIKPGTTEWFKLWFDKS